MKTEKPEIFIIVIDVQVLNIAWIVSKVQVLNIDMNETCPFADFMIKLERYREKHIRNGFKKLLSDF